MQYELTPAKPYNITRKGGKGDKMSTKKQEVPTAKTRRVYSKTRGEHYKDIVIAILITAIIAFICGAVFQSKQQGAIVAAVEAVTPSAQAETLK